MTRPLDLRGMRFGELTVVAEAGRTSASKVRWRCVCSCGKEHTATGNNLKTGGVASCGHVARAKTTRHGLTGAPEYRVWHLMVQRCHNPRHDGYSRYGGRGISACDRWRRDFACFYADMGPRPFAGAQLDRVDNDGCYEPGNCRWVTCRENQWNTSKNTRLTYRGETKCMAEWCFILGINYSVVCSRISERGWSVEEAFNTPIKSRAPRRAI